ncbi:signal peptide peptidase SppA [Candidatus Margulisiibacteriota bacterium]
MNRKIYFKQFLIIIFIIIIYSPAQGKNLLHKTLKDGINIRALSMGNAYTAIAEGSNAGYYNPAGLARRGAMYKYQNLDYKNLEHNELYSHSLYVSPFEFQYWKNQDLNGDSVEVTAYSFAKTGRKPVNWGITYKSVLEKYQGHKNTGWSTDLGILVHLTRNIDLGFCAHDLFKENLKVPATAVFGASVFTFNKAFILTSDIVTYKDGNKISLSSRLGSECNIADGLILRAGCFDEYLTGGVDLTLPFGELEYGFIYNLTSEQDPVHMLGIRIGKGLVQPTNRRRYTLFKQKAFAEFRISKNLIEGKSEISLFGGSKIGSNELLSLIHQANQDPSCKGFIIRIGSISSSLSSIALVQEIRKELERAKSKDKTIIAYLENWATLPEYYLASVASKIIMPELGTISHLGISLEITKTKDFLDNWGIGSQIISSGKYKDNLLASSGKLSEEEEVVLEELINNLYHQVLYDVKEDRKIAWEKVGKIFDGRIIPASEAKELGLVDELGYWDKAKELVKTKKKKMPPIERLVEFSKIAEPATIFSPFNRIGVIEIDGPIQDGKNNTNFLFGGKSTGAEDIDAFVEAIKKDPSMKGVVLRINSSGGSMLASDKIYRSIEKLKKAKKVVYTSMGNVAASGGYYISMNSNKIMANPGTLTGSIGVISAFHNYQELNKILGIDSTSIKTGKFMDMFSTNKELTKEELKLLKNYQDRHYKFFVDKLKDNRKLTDKEIKEVAQGQILTGKQAVDYKMVDELGNFYDTISSLSQKINISDPELVFFRSSEKPGFFNILNLLNLM